jgi:hypothetical protein
LTPENIVILLILSSFGPYLIGSVRAEHIAVYGLALYCLPTLMTRARIKRFPLCMFVLWSFILMISLVTSIPNLVSGKVTIHAFLAGLDHLLFPVAIMAIVASVRTLSRFKSEDMIDVAAATLRIALAINTLWILLGLIVDTTDVSRWFWAPQNGSIRDPVAVRALSGGRLVGIFNQPAEAGLAYSIGLLVGTYEIMNGLSRGKRGRVLTFALVVLGGILSTSKIFILGGLPLAVLWRDSDTGVGRRYKRIKVAVIALSVIMVAALFAGGFGQGISDMMTRLTPTPQKSFFQKATAGRMGEYDGVTVRFRRIWQQAWLTGLGFGMVDVLDSAYLQMFSYSGILGLIAYMLVMLGLMLRSTLVSQCSSGNLGSLFRRLVVLTILSGMGIPALTSNRSGCILTLMLCILSTGYCHPLKTDGTLGTCKCFPDDSD